MSVVLFCVVLDLTHLPVHLTGDLHIVATNNMQNKRNTVKIVMYRKQKCMEFEYDKSRKPLL